MKLLFNIAPLLLLIFACKMCDFSGKTFTASELNPYRGSLEELAPKEKSLGVIKFKQTAIRHTAFRGATDAVEADYEQSAGAIIVSAQLKVANFPSAQSAEAALQTIAGGNSSELQPKAKSGRTVGKRFTDQNGKAILWTNGSLLCVASSQFAKTTSNLEEILPF